MSILYSVVSRRNIVLARHADVVGNFSEVTEQLLSKIDSAENVKKTFSHGKFLYHYVCQNGLIFLCIADAEFRRSVAFAFLDKVKSKFETQFGAQISAAIPFAMNTEFAPVLASEMKRANVLGAQEQEIEICPDDPSEPSTSRRGRQMPANVDKVERVRDEVDRVKDIMVANIEAILERGERLELLVDKTEHLSNHSVTFKQASRNLARKMWWQHTRTIVGVALSVILFVYIVVSVSCGGLTWPHCIPRNGTN